MHTWSLFGYFDRTLCPVKFNYGQTLANLYGNRPLSTEQLTASSK